MHDRDFGPFAARAEVDDDGAEDARSGCGEEGPGADEELGDEEAFEEERVEGVDEGGCEVGWEREEDWVREGWTGEGEGDVEDVATVVVEFRVG